jgi:hypothetical protein
MATGRAGRNRALRSRRRLPKGHAITHSARFLCRIRRRSKGWRTSSFSRCRRILRTGTRRRGIRFFARGRIGGNSYRDVYGGNASGSTSARVRIGSEYSCFGSVFAPGPLTESDLRAIAASLAGATALVPGTPGTVPTPPVAGSPLAFSQRGRFHPWRSLPRCRQETNSFLSRACQPCPVHRQHLRPAARI